MSVDKSGNRVRQMFGEIAGSYDFLNHLLSMNVDRYWRWRTARKTAPRGEGPVLDICTGTGDLALAYYKATGGRARVVASDFCHPMLVIGDRKKARAGANGRVTFIEADSLHLPFPDERFEVVSVAFGLRNVQDTDRGLREMVRVCRPGGQVVVLEFSLPRRQPIKACYGWYFRHVLPRIGRLLAPNRQAAYNYLPESVGEFPSYERLQRKMLDAGLSEARFHPLCFGIATLYIGTK